MRIAAIDIGTNTILMLVAEMGDNGELVTINDEQVFARLGKGVDAEKRIKPDTFERVSNFLRMYQTRANECRCDKILACGTSALRDAINKVEFCEFIRSRLGINIRILSADEEAAYTYQGTLSGVKDRVGTYAVLDIGGGSTEIVVGDRIGPHLKRSIDIGAVRITERYFKQSPPLEKSLMEASDFLDGQTMQIEKLDENVHLYGVAGTLTTLAGIDIGLTEFDRSKIDNHVLIKASIQSIFGDMKTKTLDELRRFPSMPAGREDVIVAGILILLRVMEKLQRDSIRVSVRGLRYGIALEGLGAS
jgi:exopolyphosphatase/guanosine-5'-triphosphate,3'-diphosphate pyrophosphatase